MPRLDKDLQRETTVLSIFLDLINKEWENLMGPIIKEQRKTYFEGLAERLHMSVEDIHNLLDRKARLLLEDVAKIEAAFNINLMTITPSEAEPPEEKDLDF